MSRALEAMTAAYNFERDLLDRCKHRRLKRVVIPLAGGTVQVPGNFGDLGNVCYLIFELASGDIRKEASTWQAFDLAWALRSLHQTATGLRQLHSIGIAHQDLKPSNVLAYPETGCKVADLGCASCIDAPSETDGFVTPGDPGYAPPEQWYGWHQSPDFAWRYVADLYLLGSLFFFYFLRCSATHAIHLKISKIHRKQFSRTDFLQDLPYIQHAFVEALHDLTVAIKDFSGHLTSEIVMLAKQLCEPDPRLRGDPKTLSSMIAQHNLQPYISRLDRLARYAEARMI